VGASLAATCGGSSRADAIVGDETLFNEEFPEAIEFMRDECPAFAEAAGVQVDRTGAATANAGLAAAVPEGYRPELARVTERYGAPDSVAGDLHYYDDIALRVDASGHVVGVEMPCGTAKGGE
jgi:hypothetical protein